MKHTKIYLIGFILILYFSFLLQGTNIISNEQDNKENRNVVPPLTISNSLVYMWNRTWGGAVWDESYEAAVDSSGNVYLSRTTKIFGAGDCDMVLVKYDGINQSNLDYDQEIELEYGIPTQISEVWVNNSQEYIKRLYIKANYTNNNGSIWIENQSSETIWKDNLTEIIERNISVYANSRKYTLWANSSTLGNNTLYFTFEATIGFEFVGDPIGLIVLIAFLPIIIVGIVIYAKKHKGVKKPSFSSIAKN